MARLHIRPRPGYNDSADLSFDSTGSESVPPTKNSTKLTVDTSSLTSSDISQLRLPNLPAKDELILLRQRVKIHEKREEQLMNDVVQIQDKLEFSKKNTNRWKCAAHGDVRSGSHYRKEIVLLKQELDNKDDDIRDLEITIENLIAKNHPSHSFLVGHSVSQQTSVCSSLVDETVAGSQREVDRLLSEKSSYVHQLRQQDEEVYRLRKKLTESEEERIDMKQKIDIYEEETPTTNKNSAPSQPSVEKEEVRRAFECQFPSFQSETSSKCRTKKTPSTIEEYELLNSLSSVPFNPFQLTDGEPSIAPHLESAYNLHGCSDSIRTMKSVIEMHKELNKTKKERNSFRDELEQSLTEAKRLRSALYDTQLQSIKKNDTFVSKSDEAKRVLHDCETSTSASNHYEAKIREMNGIIDRQKTEAIKRDSIIFELEQMSQLLHVHVPNLPVQEREIKDLKEALDESLMELESAAEVMTEQRRTIQDMKKTSSAKEDDYLQLKNYLEVETQSLEMAKGSLMKKDAEIEKLSLTVKKFESHEKNFMLKDNEIKSLRQIIITWEDRCDNLRKKIVEEETQIDCIKNSILEVEDIPDEKNVVVGNNFLLENSQFGESTRCLERVNKVSLDVKLLEPELSNLLGTNESLLSLQNKVEKAKNSEKETVSSYESQITTLTMNKDVTINTLRKDLSASRSRNAEEVARLTDILSRMREENMHLKKKYSPDAMQIKDQRIYALERTLHAQEETMDCLRFELGQIQRCTLNASAQRRKDLEELQKELIESKSASTNQDRECTNLKAKLNEYKAEYEKNTKSLGKEIERLKKELSRELQDTNIMLEAKQRLEHLKFVNFELKEDNVKLNANLEQALSKIKGVEAENKIFIEVEKECATLRKKLVDLEFLLDENERAINQKSRVTDNSSNQGKGKRIEKGKRVRLIGWRKGVAP